MSPQRHELMVFIGMVSSGWWTHLSQVQKALAALAVVAVVAFSAGTIVNQMMMDRTGLLKRMDDVEGLAERAERIAVRDSSRVDAMELEQREASGAIRRMEGVLDRLDDRTARMTCMLAGRPASQCI